MILSPSHSHLTPHLTPNEYLQLEPNSPIKHEYIDGQVYAMAGASDAHVTVTGNLFALLRNHVRGGSYRVYIADMKARIESLNRFYYPDVMVTCDPRDRETPTYKRYPTLIVEVLSNSTEAFDRGDKFTDYMTLASLQEYVLVNTRQQRLDCFRRNTEGLWVLQVYGIEQPAFQLHSIGFEGRLEALYEDAVFDPPLPAVEDRD